jgi:hypothetical protein
MLTPLPQHLAMRTRGTAISIASCLHLLHRVARGHRTWWGIRNFIFDGLRHTHRTTSPACVPLSSSCRYFSLRGTLWLVAMFVAIWNFVCRIGTWFLRACNCRMLNLPKPHVMLGSAVALSHACDRHLVTASFAGDSREPQVTRTLWKRVKMLFGTLVAFKSPTAR